MKYCLFSYEKKKLLPLSVLCICIQQVRYATVLYVLAAEIRMLFLQVLNKI